MSRLSVEDLPRGYPRVNRAPNPLEENEKTQLSAEALVEYWAQVFYVKAKSLAQTKLAQVFGEEALTPQLRRAAHYFLTSLWLYQRQDEYLSEADKKNLLLLQILQYSIEQLAQQSLDLIENCSGSSYQIEKLVELRAQNASLSFNADTSIDSEQTSDA